MQSDDLTQRIKGVNRCRQIIAFLLLNLRPALHGYDIKDVFVFAVLNILYKECAVPVFVHNSVLVSVFVHSFHRLISESKKLEKA